MAKKLIRRYSLMVMLLLIVATSLRSQVLIIPEVQNTGAVFRQQLWSVVVNNASGQPQKAILVISVVDRNTSQVVLEANSMMLVFNAGVKRVTYNDLLPVTYTVASPGFGMDSRVNQPIPVGEYVACYKLLDATKNTTLASECVKIIAEPLSPPQLIQPENGSIVMEPRPVLTWTPPAPVYMFNSLSYDIIVSPLYDNQSAVEALQRNIPVMTTMSANNSILYPSTFTDLQPGKTYVWQVVAKDAGNYGGKSEVWTFTVMPDSVKQIINNASYVRIALNNQSEIASLHQGVLKVDYENRAGDESVEAVIEDMTDAKAKPVTFRLSLHKGQNLIVKDINKLGRFNEDHVYKLTIRNSKGQNAFLRFSAKYYF